MYLVNDCKMIVSQKMMVFIHNYTGQFLAMYGKNVDWYTPTIHPNPPTFKTEPCHSINCQSWRLTKYQFLRLSHVTMGWNSYHSALVPCQNLWHCLVTQLLGIGAMVVYVSGVPSYNFKILAVALITSLMILMYRFLTLCYLFSNCGSFHILLCYLIHKKHF